LQLVNRSRRRPLAVPFVYTDTSTLLARAAPDAKALTVGGHLAVNRTIPVPWAKSGGVDTFHSNAHDLGTRNAVREAQARVRDAVVTLHNDTVKAAIATVRAMAVKRDEVLSAGAVKVARTALEVRQERLRRIAAKAADATARRERRQKNAAAFMDGDEGEERGGGGGGGGAAGGAGALSPDGDSRATKADPLVLHAGRLPKLSKLLSTT